MIGLENKVALVTGASKGIGAATASLFAELGASVAVHYRSDEAGAREVARSAAATKGRAEIFAADLARWDAAEPLVASVERVLGPLDVLVCNHGIWKGAPIDRMSEREYDEMLDANVRGVYALCGAAARAMRRSGRRGNIVLVGSTAGQRGEAGHAHYAGTKGAVMSLTKSLAAELAPEGIRVNCVAPGWVDTTMTAPALSDPARRASVHAAIPLGRVGSPAEIAGPIAFVASDLASFITGEILNVNGGAVLCG
jgi:3-oxoacyl-[acyl-carrier protein] reductase